MRPQNIIRMEIVRSSPFGEHMGSGDVCLRALKIHRTKGLFEGREDSSLPEMNRFHPKEVLEPRTVTYLLHLGADFGASRRALSGSRSRVPGFLYQDSFINELCKY